MAGRMAKKLKENYILGLSLSHCASACLIKNGKVVGAVSEERLNRKKNCLGYPKSAITFLLKENNLLGQDLDYVVIHGLSPQLADSDQGYQSIYSFYDKLAEIFYYLPFLRKIYQPLYGFLRPIYTKHGRQAVVSLLKSDLGIAENKILFADHHLCHAYAPLFGLLSKEQREKKWLIFTNDGMGDDYCTAINIFDQGEITSFGKKTNNDNSFSLIYTAVTRFLGMKTLEHEYKVMGLAPYADKIGQKKSYEILRQLVSLKDDYSFSSKVEAPSFFFWVKHHLEGHRFDWVAGASQQLLDELLLTWIKRAIKETGINKAIFAGGIFMNVKANMLISQLSGLKEVCFMPSATDESTAIGAAYFGYQKLCHEKKQLFNPLPLPNLYLGCQFSESEIETALEKGGIKKKYQVEKITRPEKKIAKLLAQGKIIARFCGPMEFGARALGNRSILASPKDPSTIRIINEQIKGRDFWMPFAPVILEERQKDYLVNPKKLKAPFMILAFPTTEKGKKDLMAAIHPYDFTCRPQIINKDDTPSYYQIVKEFEKLTGIGALLNTSFNLHGEPIVCSPEDALYTFENSGLEYLFLEDYLISKKITGFVR
ncbi:MAG: hypothetical protein M1514_00150 [Patescibacteria group bacterium]|nr:hypothetical protein [Patescibacteria group bacterium]